MWQLTVEQQRCGTRLKVFGWLGSGMCYTGVCVAGWGGGGRCCSARMHL